MPAQKLFYASGDKGATDDQDDSSFKLLSKQGLLFRLKMIEYCKPIQMYGAGDSSVKNSTPKYITKDITKSGGLLMDRIMEEDPNTLIDFTAWTTQHHIRLGVTKVERRKNRTLIKHKGESMFDDRARLDYLHYVLNNNVIWILVLLAGLLNVIAQVFWDEYFEELATNPNSRDTVAVFYALIFMDNIVVFVFVIETLLWCCYDVKHYIKTFSFWVTLISVTSTAYMTNLLLYNGLFWTQLAEAKSVWRLENQRVVILSLLSIRLILCTRLMIMFKQIEIILTSLIQALPGLAYVAMMMVVTTLLYWLMGMAFFVEREREMNTFVLIRYIELGLNEGGACLMFLFRLYTFDNWLDDFKAAEAFHGAVASFYILLWMVISNYVFGNLFAAVLINNFQTVRERLLGQYVKMKELVGKIDALRLLRDELQLENTKFQRDTILDLRVPYERRANEAKASLDADIIRAASSGSVVLQVDEKLQSDESIPYLIRDKLGLTKLGAPVFDTIGYLSRWPRKHFLDELRKKKKHEPVSSKPTPNVVVHVTDVSAPYKGAQESKTVITRKGKPKGKAYPSSQSPLTPPHTPSPHTAPQAKPAALTTPKIVTGPSIRRGSDSGSEKTGKSTQYSDNPGSTISPHQALELNKLLVQMRNSNFGQSTSGFQYTLPSDILSALRPLTPQEMLAIEEDILEAADQQYHQQMLGHSSTHGEAIVITDEMKKSVQTKKMAKSQTVLPSRIQVNVPAFSGVSSKRHRSIRHSSQIPSRIKSSLHLSKSVAEIHKLAKNFDPKEIQSKLSLLSLDSVLQDQYRVRNMIPALQAQQQQDYTSVWAKDTLFGYFQVVEQLFENLKEREELLQQANQCIVGMTDTHRKLPSEKPRSLQHQKSLAPKWSASTINSLASWTHVNQSVTHTPNILYSHSEIVEEVESP